MTFCVCVFAGSNHMYVFINPSKPQAPKDTPNEITYEFAQKEIAQAKGFRYDSGGAVTKGRTGCCHCCFKTFISVPMEAFQVRKHVI